MPVHRPPCRLLDEPPPGGAGLLRLNAASPADAEAAFLHCCGSRHWARLMTGHRPYPNLAALLAAADEAAFVLGPGDLAEALAGEHPIPLPPCAGPAARTALRAAQAAYERRFGRAFVICLSGVDQDERVNHLLGGIRARLGNDDEEERAIAAGELRAVVRARLTRRTADPYRVQVGVPGAAGVLVAAESAGAVRTSGTAEVTAVTGAATVTGAAAAEAEAAEDAESADTCAAVGAGHAVPRQRAGLEHVRRILAELTTPGNGLL